MIRKKLFTIIKKKIKLYKLVLCTNKKNNNCKFIRRFLNWLKHFGAIKAKIITLLSNFT